MVKIMSVVGARPNFMKAAPVMQALGSRKGWEQRLVHTGQHYDEKLSSVFFDELGLPKPDLHLAVGSGSHAWQMAEIMLRFEQVVLAERPSLVIVYGDVNSTLACALVCSKMDIPVAHVEAGLRSFDRTMPEEVNRTLTDHLADYLFITELSARRNLVREGIAEEKIFFVGNVMVDTLLRHRDRAAKLRFGETLGLPPRSYGLLTLHRPSNVDEPEMLVELLEVIQDIATELPIIFPCHPRTLQQLKKSRLKTLLASGREGNGTGHSRLIIMEPLGYLEFLSLMTDARLVLTDSGGVQEETTVLGVPCLTLRENTERPVTIEQGTNVLAGTSRGRVLEAAAKVLQGKFSAGSIPALWDGSAAERIAMILEERLLPAACQAERLSHRAVVLS